VDQFLLTGNVLLLMKFVMCLIIIIIEERETHYKPGKETHVETGGIIVAEYTREGD